MADFATGAAIHRNQWNKRHLLFCHTSLTMWKRDIIHKSRST